MDQKWKYDLASLLRVHKPHYVNVTCKGSDNGFVAYQHAITNRFAQHQIVWKRHGKPFPYPLTFPLRFCAFDETLCFGPHMTQADLPIIAYLHLYVIDSASVDEYRTSVRHNVSEWFAKVSSKSDVQWLIVVDSTRAKDKKNRASLMEKLKQDFSKHTSRLIEVSESVEHGSFTGLVQAVQSALLNHLDILTGTWEASLQGLRGKYTDVNWNLSAYCSSTMEYARLYWSLGALEHALTIYDELDLFLADIVNEMAGIEAGQEPRWVVSLRSAGLPFRSLYSSFEQSKLDCKKDHGLVAIRHFLVAHQILLSLYLYNSRHRSRGAAPSIRVDFAALVLRYTKHVLSIAMDQSRIALMNVSSARLACWSLVISWEALHIAGLLADPSTVDGAASSVCAIQTQRFFSMLDLANLSNSGQSETKESLFEWLSTEDSSGGPEYLREMLQSESNFAQQLLKTHESATSTLLQWGRSRQAAHVGWRMAEWMRANGREAGALPLELRFISSLLNSGMRSQAVVDVMKKVVPYLKDDIDYERLLAYRLFMAVHESNEDERKKIAEDLVDQITKKNSTEKITLIDPPRIPRDLFQGTVGGFTPIVQIPNGRISMDFVVTSSLPIPIDNFCLRVKLREVDEHVLSRRKQPVYDVHFSERDQVCRVVTLHKHSSRHKSHSQSKSPVETRPTEELLLTSSNHVVTPGQNEIIVSALARARGCFIMDSVKAILFGGALVVDIDDITARRFVTVFVQSTPNKLWIDDSKDLLAGVVQRVNVTIEAGSSVDCSEIDIRADNNEGIEFMACDGVWSSNISVDVPPLGVSARHTFELVLCLLMDAGLTASPAIRRAKISFEWLGRVWSLELPFVALLIMTSSTSMLENKTLFELEIARAVGHADEWTVVLESAVIEAVDPSTAGSTPNQLGKLLNRDLGEMIPNVVASLIWVLPLSSDLPISHKLSIDYRVKSKKVAAILREEYSGSFFSANVDLELLEHLREQSSLDGRDVFIDRLYTYRETFDLLVPKVGYELCAQMLSQQPGAQLCRAGAACDLVISLRSLSSIPSVEILYIVLDADEKLWTLTERAKVLQVKESGLGQIAFSVMPCAAGFLPYPSVSVYSCKSTGSRIGETWSEGQDILPGVPLLSFLRTAGKQIRVLAASQTESEPAEQKKGLKHKLGKLFD